jgi:hypothetical protein
MEMKQALLLIFAGAMKQVIMHESKNPGSVATRGEVIQNHSALFGKK